MRKSMVTISTDIKVSPEDELRLSEFIKKEGLTLEEAIAFLLTEGIKTL